VHSDLPTPGSIDALLAELWRQRGTDLMLTSGVPPMLRVDGRMRPVVGLPVLDEEAILAVLRSVLTPAQSEAFSRANEFDFSFTWQEIARIRGNAFRQRGQVAVALRMIPREIPSMADLGLPPVLETFLARPQGLFLVTGPTGSGKSTTLAAMVEWINTHQARHILTIEDPIEYVHDHQRSVVNQREVGTDTEDFPAALRSALREDPDVLLVGEMRDLESIQFALTIAETGHLVLATLHTNDTAQALSRIVDVFPAERQAQIRVQLAAALTGIVYQRLLPRIDGGLVAAHEVLIASSAVRNLVREGKTAQLRNALVTGQKDGMVTFEQSLSALVRSGTVSYQDAVAHSLYPRDVEPAPQPIRATA
jgi:twitching motility protein PilT